MGEGIETALKGVRVAFDKKSKKNSNASAVELCVGAIGKDATRKGVQFDKRQGKGSLFLLIIGNLSYYSGTSALPKWERKAGTQSSLSFVFA